MMLEKPFEWSEADEGRRVKACGQVTREPPWIDAAYGTETA